MVILSICLQFDEICMSSYQVILAYFCSNMTMKIGPKILKMAKNPVGLIFFGMLTLNHINNSVRSGLVHIIHYF